MYHNKIEEIQAFVDTEKPDLFYISEANLKYEILDQPHLISVRGYELVLPKTTQRYQHARLVLLVRDNLKYTVVHDLMSDEMTSIWVRPVIQGVRKTFIGGGVYRSTTYCSRTLLTTYTLYNNKRKDGIYLSNSGKQQAPEEM